MLFVETFKAMHLKETRLTSVRMSTYEVGPKELSIFGCVELPAMFIGEGPEVEPRFTFTMIKWLVVDIPSSYNTIIGRGTQTVVHMRTDVKYLTVTFETDARDVMIYISQREARSIMAVSQKAKQEA